jgi:hypothetical protein
MQEVYFLFFNDSLLDSIFTFFILQKIGVELQHSTVSTSRHYFNNYILTHDDKI